MMIFLNFCCRLIKEESCYQNALLQALGSQVAQTQFEMERGHTLIKKVSWRVTEKYHKVWLITSASSYEKSKTC